MFLVKGLLPPAADPGGVGPVAAKNPDQTWRYTNVRAYFHVVIDMSRGQKDGVKECMCSPPSFHSSLIYCEERQGCLKSDTTPKRSPTVWSDRDLQDGFPLNGWPQNQHYALSVAWMFNSLLASCYCLLLHLASCFLFPVLLSKSYSSSCHLAFCLLASCSFASCFLPLLALASCLLLLVPNVSFWTDEKMASKLRPSILPNRGFATPKHYATEGRAKPFGARLPVNNVAFWTDKKLAPNCSLPKPWPRYAETPCKWRTDQAFGLRLPVPNVAYKLQPSRFQNLGLATLKHRATGGRTRPSACGCLCLTLLTNCSRQDSKTLASPHWNTAQLEDGPGLRPAAACA